MLEDQQSDSDEKDNSKDMKATITADLAGPITDGDRDGDGAEEHYPK
jgi:hypothetical protein